MNSRCESLYLLDDIAVQRSRRFNGRHLWENDRKPELILQFLSHTSVGTTMIYIQPDAEDTFSEVNGNMKKLGLMIPRERGQKKRSGATRTT